MMVEDRPGGLVDGAAPVVLHHHLRIFNDAGFGDIGVAVNVSPLRFRNENLEHVIAQALGRHAVKAHRLTLELTESMLMESPGHAISLFIP
jgi:EAL domain-containing protein (putative c-di-GMP-specific phosphodiesterase class I)